MNILEMWSRIRDFNDASRLEYILNLKPWQFDKARRLGLIADPDLPAEHWSRSVVESMVMRAESIVRGVERGERPGIGAPRAARLLSEAVGVNTHPADVERLCQLGYITRAGEFHGHNLYNISDIEHVVANHAAEVRQLAANRHDRVGASLAAALLSEAVCLKVQVIDMKRLCERGLITPSGSHDKHDLYNTDDIERLIASNQNEVERVVYERETWVRHSLTHKQALARLSWRERDFKRTARDRGIKRGLFGRYARQEIEALANDRELRERMESKVDLNHIGREARLFFWSYDTLEHRLDDGNVDRDWPTPPPRHFKPPKSCQLLDAGHSPASYFPVTPSLPLLRTPTVTRSVLPVRGPRAIRHTP